MIANKHVDMERMVFTGSRNGRTRAKEGHKTAFGITIAAKIYAAEERKRESARESQNRRNSRVDYWLDMDHGGRRWWVVAPLDKRAVEADQRLVRPVFRNFGLSADLVVLRKIRGRQTV